MEIRDGLLGVRWESDGRVIPQFRVLLPVTHRREASDCLHASTTGGHLRQTKMVAKLLERFYWPGVRGYLERWVVHCDVCAAHGDGDFGSRIRVSCLGATTAALRQRGIILDPACSGVRAACLESRRPGRRHSGPQSDGLVERFNRTLGNMLLLMVSSHQRDWDEVLPMAMMA